MTNYIALAADYGAEIHQDGNAFGCWVGDYSPEDMSGWGDTPEEAAKEFMQEVGYFDGEGDIK